MLAFLIAAAAAAASPAPRAADPVVGTWMNRKETVAVATRRCGRGICGRVVWAAPEAEARAQAGGTARLVGTELLQNLEPAGPNTWQGMVFVPDLGTTAQAQLTITSPTSLQIDGCQYGGLMCKTQEWHRVRPIAGR